METCSALPTRTAATLYTTGKEKVQDGDSQEVVEPLPPALPTPPQSDGCRHAATTENHSCQPGTLNLTRHIPQQFLSLIGCITQGRRPQASTSPRSHSSSSHLHVLLGQRPTRRSSHHHHHTHVLLQGHPHSRSRRTVAGDEA